MMRVTGKMIRQRILANIESAMERLQFAQTQMATGKRIQTPSDDPISLSKSLKVRALLADNQQFVRNIDDAIGWIDNTEPVLDEIVETIITLKEIAIRGASDTETDYERSALAEQIDGLIDNLVGLGNTRYGHRYVFSGTHTLTAPYTSEYTVSGESVSLPDLEWALLGNARLAGGSVTVTGSMGETYIEGVDYEIDHQSGAIRRLGGGSMGAGSYTVSYQTETICRVELNVPDTDGAINREVARGVYERLNTGGEDIFASRVAVFDLMVRVKNALFRDDGIDVNQSLDEIEDALEQVSSALSDIGVKRNAFDLARAKLDSEMVNLQAMISRLEDADLAEVMVRFQGEQTAYESALAAAGQIMNTSLINFIT
jgi:flagellar hook-associated protein 3 FlgL